MATTQQSSRIGAEEQKRHEAAVDIQRYYRGHRERRQLKGLHLTPDQRWTEAVADAHLRMIGEPVAPTQRVDSACGQNGSPGSQNDAPRRKRSFENLWGKAMQVARKAQHDDLNYGSSSSTSEDEADECKGEKSRKKEERRQKKALERKERAQYAKTMELQYFLEMVDLKHRHGSNLKAYHNYWKQQDTKQNFFFWLDDGDGKNVDLDVCPRERLERQTVRYLSFEERQAYLVKIDKEGRLCWAKNGERIDTTAKYSDSKYGIVPADDPEAYQNDQPRHEHEDVVLEHSPSSSSSSSISSESSPSSSPDHSRTSGYADRYLDMQMNSYGQIKRFFHVRPAIILNRLLRKKVRKNTWIFVTDTSFRLYVGIKQTGSFQHSSFLHGGRVTAAGLIKIKNGKLKSLSPLSGHYRPSAWLFKKFLHSLREEGADLSRVTISKSYAILIGLEAWANVNKGKKKIKAASKKAEHKIITVARAGHGKPQDENGVRDAAKGKKEEQMSAENGLLTRFMQKRSPQSQCEESKVSRD